MSMADFGRPLVNLLLRVFLEDAVVLLELAKQLLFLASDNAEVVVGELCPLRFDVSLQLVPLSFDLIPVHFPVLGRCELSVSENIYGLPQADVTAVRSD